MTEEQYNKLSEYDSLLMGIYNENKIPGISPEKKKILQAIYKDVRGTKVCSSCGNIWLTRLAFDYNNYDRKPIPKVKKSRK